MFQKILFCTDLSIHSESALQFAIGIAEKTGAKMIVTHSGISLNVDNPGMDAFPIFWGEAEQEINDKLRNLCKTIATCHHVEAIPLHREMAGSINLQEQNLLKEAREHKSDLIVAGPNVMYGLQKMFGTTSSHGISRSTFPVLIIPEGTRYREFQKIIHTTDLRDEEYHTLQTLQLTELFGAALTFLHIDNPGHIGSDQKRFASYRKHISEKTDYPDITYDTITFKEAAMALNDYSKQQKADLIVMIKHNHNLWEGLLHQSTTKEILFQSDLPLLIYH